MKKYVCVILLVVIPGMVESARTDADPSVLNSQKSGRLERPSLAKSPLTVIIMGDAEELLHLNKQWSKERETGPREVLERDTAARLQEEDSRVPNRPHNGRRRPSSSQADYQYQMIGNHFAPLPTDLNKQTPHRPMKPSAANVNEQEWIQHPIVKSLLDFFYNQFNADGF